MTERPDLPDAHALSPDEVAARLAVDPTVGLGSAEVERRAAAAGPNALEVRRSRPVWRLVVEAATEPFVVLLVVAGVLAVAPRRGPRRPARPARPGRRSSGADVVTEYRGERALEALREASAPMARVRRDGTVLDVRGRGPRARATSSSSGPATSSRPTCGCARVDGLLVDRSVLTGESVPEPGRTAPDCDRRRRSRPRGSMAYSGTSVVGGRGEGIVVAIGPATEVGRIAGGLATRGAPPVAAPARARPARPDPARRRDRADRRSSPSLGFVRGQDARREPAGRHLGRDRGDPRGAADPARGHPRARRLSAPPARRARPPAQRGGDARRGRPDRHRQDRDADPEPARGRLDPRPRPARSRTPDRRGEILLDALRAEDDAWHLDDGVAAGLVHARAIARGLAALGRVGPPRSPPTSSRRSRSATAARSPGPGRGATAGSRSSRSARPRRSSGSSPDRARDRRGRRGMAR